MQQTGVGDKSGTIYSYILLNTCTGAQAVFYIIIDPLLATSYIVLEVHARNKERPYDS